MATVKAQSVAATPVSNGSSTATGLDTTKITKMQNALTTYQNAVKKSIDFAASRANINKAIKGTASENSLMKLNKAIDTKLESYMVQLNQYATILTNLKATYSKNDTGNTTFADMTKNIQK